MMNLELFSLDFKENRALLLTIVKNFNTTLILNTEY